MTSEELIKTYFANQHILQSRPWGEFKTLMGTRAITIGNAQLTMHKIPFTPWKVGYCPKVRPEDLDLEKLYDAAKKEGCIFVKIDVPHAPYNYQPPATSYQLNSGKPIFAQSTILMDLTKSDGELLANMHEKARYNLRLAQKKDVQVKIYPDDHQGHPLLAARGGLKEVLEEFINLQRKTAKRQKFFIHPDHYYRACFETLAPRGLAYLLEAAVPPRLSESTPARRSLGEGGDKTPGVSSSLTAASWMLFRHGDVLYYPYGESNYELRSYMASNLLMWEAVQLGKKLGCKVFDLWGSANDPDDKDDPWYGFTRFKMGFDGIHLKLAPTYDLIINKPLYDLFNFLDNFRWKLLRATR